MDQPHRPARPRLHAGRLGVVPLALSALLGLGACSSGGPPPPDATALRAYAARGYSPLVHEEVTTTAQEWPVGLQTVHGLLSRPQRGAPLPLVVYLPGLGETAAAGAAWRQAWAAAGYAVLALQPLAEDAAAFRSELARVGDFRALGLQRYGAAAMAQRVQVLADVLAQAQRRGTAGDAAWQGIAWDRVAVAGYDLGAYTAMVLAGEAVRGAGPAPTPVAVKAAIALSPYASVAEGALATRYAGIAGPVLSVTSDSDGDALGLVGAPALRYAPFEHMPGPGKALLAMQGLSHARLSGGGGVQEAAAKAPERDPGTPADDGSGRNRNGGNGGGNGNGRHRQGAEGPGPQALRSDAADAGVVAGLGATAVELRLLAVQDVSTAFLDAYVKDDALARDWLAGHAAGWLGRLGELRLK
jgi:dienelactone hydrolase